MIRNKFLDDLGIPMGEYFTNFVSDDDERTKSWKEERKTYGFDNRETWCMDRIFAEWLYSRLMMYKEISGKEKKDIFLLIPEINTKQEYRLSEWMDMIIKSAKAYCLMEYWSDNFLELTITEAFKEGILVFSSLLPFLTLDEKNTDPETLKKQKELYSFDETECYNLSKSFMEWLNSRVKRYDEVNIINTSFHKFQIDGKEMTQQECMDIIIKTTENILTNRALPISEYFDKVKEVTRIWAEIYPAMWW